MAGNIDWRSDPFRQKFRHQIEETFAKHTNPFSKSAEEIENTIFTNAKSQEEYMNLVQGILKRTFQHSQAKAQQRLNQIGQQQAPPSQAGMMRPPMPPVSNVQMGQGTTGTQMQGMQIRHFNPQSVPRGPPMSDSPASMGSMQSPLSSGGMMGYSPERMTHPSPGSQYYHRPQMIGRSQQPQSVPPAQPQLKMPDNTYINTPQGSNYIPSLSPAHQTNSPQVSAMSPALRTPGSVSVAHSPGAAASPQTGQNQNNQAQSEEGMYMEKLKQLQKYIEPLSRMINKQEKNSKDLSKMKSLRDILIDSTKRLAMPTLIKCEKVLQNWLDDKPVPTPPPFRSDQHMCQPILDAVASAIKSPMLNHTLKRTFGPALQVLNGDYYVPESSCTKRARIRGPSEDNDATSDLSPIVKVPNVVQGEIARLGSKFKVTVDQSQSSSCGKLHLICRIDDPRLPSVPPIRILVPSAYPKEGPEWLKPDSDESSESEEVARIILNSKKFKNGQNNQEFLTKLMPNLETYIRHAGDHNESITAILTAWERSIKETVAAQSRESQDFKRQLTSVKH